MREGWSETTIGEQVTLQRGIDITKASQKPGNVPVVSSGGIRSFHDTAYTSGPGVVLGRKGVVGSVYYIESDYWPHDTSLWVRDFHGNHPRFVYYFFKHMAPILASMDVGSANPTLNRNHVHPIQVRWPPIAEQERIAHMLGTLDDKIELNRQMNRTLDEIARTVFTSWFVNFDPVRAKAEGRQPEGMDTETAALFPERLVDSELGPIPEGWEVRTLGDITDNVRENVSVKAMKKDDNYVGLEHLPKRQIALSEWSSTETVTSNKSRFVKGDILFGKLRPYFHKVVVAPISGVCSTDILVIRPKECRYSAVTLCAASSDQIIALADSHSAGTRMPRAKWSDLKEFTVALPTNSSLLECFEATLQPMVGLLRHNTHENRTLTELRDTLLPELLSGRIRVPEAEIA